MSWNGDGQWGNLQENGQFVNEKIRRERRAHLAGVVTGDASEQSVGNGRMTVQLCSIARPTREKNTDHLTPCAYCSA